MKQRMMPVRQHRSMFTQTNVNNWCCHQSMTVFASSELPLVIHRVDFENTSPIWWVSNTSIKTVNYCCYAAGGCLAPYFLLHFECDVESTLLMTIHIVGCILSQWITTQPAGVTQVLWCFWSGPEGFQPQFVFVFPQVWQLCLCFHKYDSWYCSSVPGWLTWLWC